MRLAAALSLLAAALLLGAILPRHAPTPLDLRVARGAEAGVGPGTGRALQATSEALQPPRSYALAAVLAAGVLLARGRRPALYVLVAVGGTLLLVHGLKGVYLRERPAIVSHTEAPPSGHSYPSGHVAFSAAALGSLAIVLAAGRRWRVRATLALAALLITAWVALARVHLGRHHFTDTVGGALLGWGWIVLAGRLVLWRRSRRARSDQRMIIASPYE